MQQTCLDIFFYPKPLSWTVWGRKHVETIFGAQPIVGHCRLHISQNIKEHFGANALDARFCCGVEKIQYFDITTILMSNIRHKKSAANMFRFFSTPTSLPDGVG